MMAKKPRRIRTQIFTFPTIACCIVCKRQPMVQFGREYLWRYGTDPLSPLVCSDACHKKSLQPPEPRAEQKLAIARALFPAARDATDRPASSQPIEEQMAQFIVTRAATEQACTFRQLIDAGFTAEQIRAHKKAAIARAGELAPDLRGEAA
jgi:hypothetical protein